MNAALLCAENHEVCTHEERAMTEANRIGALQDEIKARDRRIEELRREIDDLRDLVRRMEEQVEDAGNVIERWKEAFQMEMTESGSWTWGPFWEERDQMVRTHNDLVDRWNRFVPLINRQPVGRPLAASEAQCATVLKLRKAGKSLRDVAEETNLGLNTVRTIVDKGKGTDRATRKHRARIEKDRQKAISWKRRKRTGDALPGQAQHTFDEGKALLKEAKGLGR
jgi:hypothetical protein